LWRRTPPSIRCHRQRPKRIRRAVSLTPRRTDVVVLILCAEELLQPIAGVARHLGDERDCDRSCVVAFLHVLDGNQGEPSKLHRRGLEVLHFLDFQCIRVDVRPVCLGSRSPAARHTPFSVAALDALSVGRGCSLELRVQVRALAVRHSELQGVAAQGVRVSGSDPRGVVVTSVPASPVRASGSDSASPLPLRPVPCSARASGDDSRHHDRGRARRSGGDSSNHQLLRST
jgi:hypothetical protein